jgi:transposase-like protein
MGRPNGEIFAETKIGYVHIDSCEPRLAKGKPIMFLAIDRVSKFTVVQFRDTLGEVLPRALARGPRQRPGAMPMSDTLPGSRSSPAVTRRRRFTAEQKLSVVAETMQPGMSFSDVGRRHGLSPSLVFRWRRLMTEGGQEAVRGDDKVVLACGCPQARGACARTRTTSPGTSKLSDG